MPIPPSIHPPLYLATEKPTSKIPSFHEGAMSTTNKIVTFAIIIIASVGSFLMLPFEGAIIATLGSIFLPSFIACNNHSEDPQGVIGPPRVETPIWFHRANQLIPSFHGNHPVRQRGRRVNVGGGRHSSHFCIDHSRSPVHRAVEAIRSQRDELAEATTVYPRRTADRLNQSTVLPLQNQTRVPVGRGHNGTF